MSAELLRANYQLHQGVERSTAVELWYVVAAVTGSNNAGQFIQQVPRVQGSTPFPDASVTPLPICKTVGVTKVIGPVTGGMGAFVLVTFDSYMRYGNSPRKLSRNWTRDDRDYQQPVIIREGNTTSKVRNIQYKKRRRQVSVLEEVRYGVGEVDDAMREAATVSIGRLFVFGTIPYLLVGHRFDSVGSGYWSVTYTFVASAPLMGRPARTLSSVPLRTREEIPSLGWNDELEAAAGPTLLVETAIELYGTPVATNTLPGF